MLSTALILWFLIKSGGAEKLAIDVPEARSMHNVPTPAIGGLVAVPIAVLWAWDLTGFFPVLTALTISLCLLSWIDDRKGLPIWVRLLFHILIASILLIRNYHETLPIILFLFAVVTIAWLINLYNFMDGIDGLAGGMSVIGFGTLGIATLFSNTPYLAILCFSISGSILGFLVFNLHPAKIFMGDAGSVSLGLLASALSVEGLRRDLWSICFPLLVFSPFIADASVTLFKRIVSRERFWEAHRDHYYQRLARLGWGHSKTTRFEYGIMIVASLIAYYMLKLPDDFQWLICAAWYAILGLLMYKFDQLWHLKADN
jgi:UDP-N-acetylmuramyl pentapeptide phosphotransferase/UDP-N-acetylglucosamine-1-phosphate transferase